MKKILLLIMMLCLFGCGKNNQAQNDNKIKDKFSEYGKDYYERYSVKGFNEVNISLETLKQANEKVNASYDLSIFNNCEDSSYIKLVINNQKIDKIEYFLNCK